MRFSSLMTGFAVLAFPVATMAGQMPTLPDLPPLPTHYQGQGETGFYAGLLTGYIGGAEAGLGAGLVLGNAYQAADLLLGFEVMGLTASNGVVSIEGSLRAGLPLSDTISAFGNAGLGYSFDTATFVSIGTSLQVEVGGGWIGRADYRYDHDLSGDAGSHKVLLGLLRGF